MVKDTGERLRRVPRPRVAPGTLPADPVPDQPQDQPLDPPLDQPLDQQQRSLGRRRATPTIPTQRVGADSATPSRRRRTVPVAVAGVVALALVATGTAAWGVERDRARALDEARKAHERVDQAVSALDADTAAAGLVQTRAASTVLDAGRAAGLAAAKAALAHADATLTSSPHAGDGSRGSLQAASGALTAALGDADVSLAELRAATTGLAAPEQAAQQEQAAWQAAEDARIAAEQQAAAQAAAAAAAKAATQHRSAVVPKPRKAPAAGGAPAVQGPPPAAATGGVPAGGKVCQGSGGSGAGESSVGAIGSAINAYRQSHGLPALSVSRSGSLVAHAVDMAQTGGIWHSGHDNIVACVSNGSASSMVTAWSNSAPHNAQMLRTDVSAMSVGGASLGGWLFGAVAFS